VRRSLERFLETVTLILITALAVLVVVAVISRKTGMSLGWYDEVAAVLLAWLTYYGAALAALKRAHIGFPRMVQDLGRPWRTVWYLTRQATVIAFFAVVAWAGARVLVVLGGTTLVTLTSVPARLTQSVIPVGAVLYIGAELLNTRDWLARERRR